jgi:diguanylate cyclase (GGDEF)-like protein
MPEAGRRKWLYVLFAVAISCLIAWADSVSGSILPFQIFYLAPVFIAMWLAGRAQGLAVGGLCTALFLRNEFQRLPEPESTFVYVHVLLRAMFFMLFCGTLSALHRALEQARLLSGTDPLTSLLNRRSFLDALLRHMETTRREPRAFAAVYMDVDDFRNINHELGHRGGDEILSTISGIFKTSLRTGDVVARLGGDEFVVLLPDTPKDTAVEIVKRLHKRLQEAMSGHRCPITVSIGMMVFHKPPSSPDTVLRIPDRLMYQAKELGKNP